MKAYKYYMHIIDREFDDEYDYEGLFLDHFEAAQFMEENEAVGNTIIMIAPYIVEVETDEVELNKVNRDQNRCSHLFFFCMKKILDFCAPRARMCAG